MKKSLLFISVFTSITSFSQVGINTETPQKTLHVNGSLQLTRELNVGGNSNSSGNSGNSGQALISQGEGLPPVWQTLNIPDNNDVNSYKLKRVYQTTLNKVSISNNNTSVLLGGINNIKVGSADNFIFVTTQSNTYLGPFTDSSPTFSYRFDFILDGVEYHRTSWESIQRQGFSDVAKNNPYQFTIVNASVGNHYLNINAVRQNSQGTNRTLYFNAINTNFDEKKGSLVIFVYEK